MKNDTNGATRRSSPQVYLDHDTMNGNNRDLVRMSASDEWMAASLQNNASDISTHADLADRFGRFPNASLPFHLSAELIARSQPNLVAPYVSSEHLKALPECTGPEIHKIASSIAGIKISRTSLSIQRAATDALSNSSDVSSATLCQSNVSRTEKFPAKPYVQLPILSSYADATNFAARFPELASEVLSRPLKVAPTSGIANVEQSAPETGHPKMPEHTADRPNWALAPEVTADSNDSASIAPDEMDVDATPDVCFSDFRRAKVFVRAPVGCNGIDPESPEQPRNKRRLLRSAPCRRSHVKAANSHNRFGGMRGFGDNTQEKSTDYSSHSASSPVDWTPNTSRHSLPEASDSSKHPGCKEDKPTSCHAWDIVDDRSPRPKSDDEWENPSVEASWDSTGETVEFPNSQQAPQIDRWCRPVAQVSWEYPSSEPPKMPQSPQDLPYRSPEPAQQSPIEPVQSSSAKQLQTHPFAGWMSPSDIRGGIASQHHAEPPRSLQPRPQLDDANEWHTSLPLRRILPGDVGHASSTVVDSRLNDISIPTSPLTTPSARKSFVREAIIKAEQSSESPADIIKNRKFTQSVPLSPRPVLFRADSRNSAAPYTALGTSRGERGTAEKEPPVWNTAQTEVTPVTIDSNLPMKSVGHSKQLDAVVTPAPSPTPGDSVYQPGKPAVSATIPTAATLERVPESEVEPSIDGTGRFHIIKPKEQTIHSRPVASQSDLTPSKKRQLSSDSGDQSKVPLNASRDPERPFAMCEVPAYPSAAETPGEGKGEVDNSLLSQDKIFLEDPEAHCFSDTKASSTPERGSETQDDGPEQHLDGYAWRMGRPVSGWRRGLLDQSLSQKYIPPPARRFPPSTFREKPGLPISEQNKIYTFKLPPIAPVPGATSQDVKAAPEARVKQSVSKVKWEAPQHTNATGAGHNNNTFTTDVSAPEIIKLTELGQSSSDVHAPLSLRVASPLCNIDNADTGLASSNCFEPSKSPLMSFSETNCTPLEHRAIPGALPSDQVETPDLASQKSSSLLIASRSMGKENMLDGIPPSTPWSNNQMLSAPHPSLNVVDALQWPPPRTGMTTSIQEHILPRQDSIAVTDYLHHPSQSPSRSSNLDIYSAQNQLPTAFVHDSAFAPIQGYHCEMPSVHRHPPVQSYFHPELTQDLVGASGWIVYPNFDGDAQYLINERGAIDNTALAPQSHSRHGRLPRREHPLVNTSPSQHSGSMPQISSQPNAPSGLASRTPYPAEQEAPFLYSGKQFVSPRYPVAPSAHFLSSYAGQYDIASQTDQREWPMANSHPLHVRQNGQGYSSQDF
ncbi:hypothetical protein ARMSODRAFT_152713 [Armillaria solidipes]|uniref:Uncharacterized protein n=1 Tax=Armillaria solidipes TaxID=1076256 RepID=A0A2H3BV58_9AGAR|nr:hypothetical protein ARMSODRAFT_152713 [Armillaria solidipes]